MKNKPNVGRFELLNWINSFTRCEYQKIEHLGDCIAFCQVLNALYPKSLTLSELNFNPSSKSNYTDNTTILQNQLEDLRTFFPFPLTDSQAYQNQSPYKNLPT